MAQLLDRSSPRTNLSDHGRNRVLSALLRHTADGKLKHGSLNEVTVSFGVSPQTTQRLWRRAKENFQISGVCWAPSHKPNSGRRKVNRDQELERLRSVPLQRRSTLRSAAAACDLPLTTLFRELKVGSVRIGTSVLKPLLTDANKEQRLKFCVSHVDPSSMLFNAMDMDVIHVDEKLFYMTTVKRRYVLLPDEPVPTRRVRSKRHISKVMVLAAVARPRWDPNTGAFFDGKLGLWAFLTHEPAQRSSRYRPAGTLVPKEQSVNKSTYRAMLVQQVLPAIRAKWPGAVNGERITIQQDNAPPHIGPNDPALRAAVVASGCNVQLRFQPPNSPDLNVLDLGIFNSIQARQQLETASTLDELVTNVKNAYDALPSSTLNAAFLTLQSGMDSCIAAEGNNDFKTRHMAKDKLEREGRLPRRIQCSPPTASFVRALV